MDLTFDSVVQFISTFFGGSTTLAGLAIIVAAWAICAVVCFQMKAPPAYSVAPMLPICIFMSAYGVMNELVAVFICVISAALVASELKRAVD